MITSLSRGMDLMRKPGAVLWVDKFPSRDHFYIHPFDEVRPDIGAKIIAHPHVEPSNDGMFGTSQTFKIAGTDE